MSEARNIRRLEKRLGIDMKLLKELLLRIMTRNERDPIKAASDRRQLEKNLLTLDNTPEAHLAFTMGVIDRASTEGRSPPFEAGLMFGVTMTLSAGKLEGREVLSKMLAEITKQQHAFATQPPMERVGLMLPVDDPTAAQPENHA